MLQHPLIKNIRYLAIYFTIWFFISLIIFWFFQKVQNLSIEVSIINRILLYLYFSLSGLAIWYAVLYSYPQKQSFFNLAIHNITTIVIIVGLLLIMVLSVNKYLYPATAYIVFNNHILYIIIWCTFYYHVLILIYYIIIYQNNLKEKKASEEKLLSLIKETELSLLKSQINPHFLFNSLNSISSLTITDPKKAQDMIIKLSDYLRYSISHDNKSITKLEKEINNIHKYIEIEKIRFGERISFVEEICDECLKMLLPVMILQPLFENAIKHGVSESTETIYINFSAYKDQDFLIINISNNFNSSIPSRKGQGIGLKNIRERLNLLYKDISLMSINKSSDNFEVKLVIPQLIIS